MATRFLIVHSPVPLAWLIFGGSLVPGPTSVLAQPSIRLSGVPGQLVFPLPAGSNVILTATITGGAVRSVWLARGERAAARLLLTRVEEGQYQINLADREAQGLLAAESGAGQFQVFAETPDGATVASILVRYAVQGQAKEPPSLHLLYRGGREDVLGPWWARTWCDVEALDRLELHFSPECPAPTATVSGIAQKPFAFKAGPGPNVLVLPVDPELVRGWNEKGKLVITYRQCNRDWLPQELRAVPHRLDLPGTVARMRVAQRTTGFLPGSNDYLSVQLGDISAGYVFLSVINYRHEVLLGSTQVRQGDALPFEFGGISYTLILEELVNHLVGDDFAVLLISETVPEELRKIDRLLQVIKQSPITFLRDGESHTGAEAAEHLGRKLEHAGSKVRTLDEFIDQIASRSWTTGQPYQVKLADGQVVDAGDWLRQQPLNPPTSTSASAEETSN